MGRPGSGNFARGSDRSGGPTRKRRPRCTYCPKGVRRVAAGWAATCEVHADTRGPKLPSQRHRNNPLACTGCGEPAPVTFTGSSHGGYWYRRKTCLSCGGSSGNGVHYLRHRKDHCEYCRRPSLLLGYGDLDVDHIIPRSQGGTDRPENLITLCPSHHRHKSAIERGEWDGSPTSFKTREDVLSFLSLFEEAMGANTVAILKSATRHQATPIPLHRFQEAA